MDIQWWSLIAVGSVVFFMVISRSVVKPLKWIWFGVLYTSMGAVVLFLLNLIGEWVEFRIPINPITSFITGFLGIPGLLTLILIKLFIVNH